MAHRKHSHQAVEPGAGAFWLFGTHAVRAALANPRRTVVRAVFTEPAWREFENRIAPDIHTELCRPERLAQLVPAGSVHQGAAILCRPLPQLDLDELLESAAPNTRRIAVLDQITDPHNEGAILRSAAAFGFLGVVVQSRHSPPESGVLAKAASGALDQVPRIVVVNIARALEDLGRHGIWRVALAGDGPEHVADAVRGGDIAIVLGAEGVGLRRLVRERCDTAAAIPMAGRIESLNVSNAAAIAFYECARAGEFKTAETRPRE